MPESEFTVRSSHGTLTVSPDVVPTRVMWSDEDQHRSDFHVTGLRVKYHQARPDGLWHLEEVEASGPFTRNQRRFGYRSFNSTNLGGAPAFIGHAVKQFHPGGVS